MEISIGQLAELFGMTKEAIRYYEKKGLIKPERNTNNSYRVYNNEHVQILGTIKRLQNVGLSLNEISDILYSTTEEKLIEINEKYIQRKKNEIMQMRKLLEKIELQNDVLINLNNYRNHYSVVNRESKMFFKFETIDKLINDIDHDSDIEKWFRNLMFTNASSLIYYDSTTDEITQYARGLLVNESEAKMLGIKKNKYIIELEESRYLHSYFKYEYNQDTYSDEIYKYIVDEIVGKMIDYSGIELEPLSTILTKNICTYKDREIGSKVIISEVLLKLDDDLIMEKK